MSRLFTLIWAIVCGSFAGDMGMPLPWLLGPMFGVAFLTVAGLSDPQPQFTKRFGQLTIGITLGLYFTGQVMTQVGQMAVWVVLAAVFSAALSVLFARVFQKLSGAGGLTSVYAAAIGASSDMAFQAQAAGADGAAVATAHAVRVVLVVTIISFLAAHLGEEATMAFYEAKQQVLMITPTPLAIVAVISVAAAWAMGRLDHMGYFSIPNPWVLMPLAVAAVYALMGNETRMPDAFVAAGSLFIGWGLGQYMTREFFQTSPQVLKAAFFMTMGMLVLALLFAWGVSALAGLPLVTAIVATSPGGIAEMAITAKVLGLGAPMVTAFHLVRLVLVLLVVKKMGHVLIARGWLKA
jgi:uncharacterized protein